MDSSRKESCWNIFRIKSLKNIDVSFNGRTLGFDPENEGSNPSASANYKGENMICSKCQKDIDECQCEDIDNRIESLKDSILYRKCKICEKHYARCKCENPIWTTNHGDMFLPEEFK